MESDEWFIEDAQATFVKFWILFRRYFRRWFCPKRLSTVGLFFFYILRTYKNRYKNMIWIFLNECLEPLTVSILFGIFAQEEFYRGTSFMCITRWTDGVTGFSVTFPNVSFIFASLFRCGYNLFSDHKGRIETHTELTNKCFCCVFVIRIFIYSFQKCWGSRTCDCSKCFCQIIRTQSNARIYNFNRILLYI